MTKTGQQIQEDSLRRLRQMADDDPAAGAAWGPEQYGPIVTVPSQPVWLADFCSAAAFAAEQIQREHPGMAKRLMDGVKAAVASAETSHRDLREYASGLEKTIMDAEDVAHKLGYQMAMHYLADIIKDLGAKVSAWERTALLKDRTRRAIRERARAGEIAVNTAEDFNVPLKFVAHLRERQMFED